MLLCKWLGACSLVAGLLHAAPQDNLALHASSVTASDWSIGHSAIKAADGSVDSCWERSPGVNTNSWIELTFAEPVLIRELVIRREHSEDRNADLKHMVLEISAGNSWREVARLGDGQHTLPLIMYWPFANGYMTQKLRVSGLDANTPICELEVYSKLTPPWMDVRGDARKHYWNPD